MGKIKRFSILKYVVGHIYSIHKIEKNEMGGTCGAYGGGEKCAQGSGGET